MKALRLLFLIAALAAIVRADYDVEVTGSTSGSVWGSGPYTNDSNLGAVAVHSGLLSPGQTALMRVIALPGQSSYTGSTANGVTTSSYGPWGGSIILELLGPPGGGGGGGNHAPVAGFSGPTEVYTNQTFWVSADASDVDGNLHWMTIRWLNHGAQWTGPISGYSDSRGVYVTAPSSPDTMYMRGEASDTSDAVDASEWQTISVVASTTPPTVYLGTPDYLVINQPAPLSVSGEDVDGDLDTLYIEREGVGILQTWYPSGTHGIGVTSITASSLQTIRLRGVAIDGAGNVATGPWISVVVYSEIPPSIAVAPGSLEVGQLLTASYRAPSGGGIIRLHQVGAPDSSYLQSASVAAGLGSKPFTLDSSFQVGVSYQARLFGSDGVTLRAVSNNFTVTPTQPPSITVSPGSPPIGTWLTANYRAPAGGGIVRLYQVGASNASYLKSESVAAGLGNKSFYLDSSFQVGWSYQARLFASDGATLLVASNTFTVSPSSGGGDYEDVSVTGDLYGVIWGTDIYTDDSDRGAVAVHMGLMSPGETRLVRVYHLPGEESYESSTRNGVTSSSYGAWSGSITMEVIGGPPPSNANPVVHLDLPAQTQFEINETFTVTSTVTDVNSDLYRAAIVWGGTTLADRTYSSSSLEQVVVYANAGSSTGTKTLRAWAADVRNAAGTPGYPGYTAVDLPISILAPNAAPQALTVSANVGSPSLITFTGEAADSDGNLQLMQFLVEGPIAGSGYTLRASAPATGGSAIRSATWAPASPLAAGTYHVRLNVYDDRGESNTAATEFTFVILPDTDNDGMPDAWETAHGFSPTGTVDALQDADGDGLTNVAEYNLGKDPHQADLGTSTLGNSLPVGWPTNGDVQNTAAVGLTAGELSVDRNGAATYSVPLWVSPGTAGMEPKLSLNYSSHSGSGIAGFGWSLGGVSAITRGPQSRAVDNTVKGVTLTASDRFYLDGQRLIAVEGVYGANGTSYRTELESFSKIVSYAQQTGGPTSFKVWTKAGLIIEFGTTQDSAFNVNGHPEIISWAVSKITDTSGNFITFTYTEDNALGIQLLARIDYTGNGTDIAPYASVRFEYQERNDKTSGYLAGQLLSSRDRLKAIKSYVGETVVRTYSLGYRTNTGTQLYVDRSMLASITEIGADGSAYPPLGFDYAPNDYGWNDAPGYVPPQFLGDNQADKPTGTGFVDLNGDGRPDFVARADGSGSTNAAYLNNGSTWVSSTAYALPYRLAHRDYPDDQGSRFVDLNGDGLVDYVWSKMLAGGTMDSSGARLNTGTGWQAASQWTPPTPVAKDSEPLRSGRFADINGDGRVDYITFLTPSGANTPNLSVYLNTGTGWSATPDAGYSTMAVNLALARAKFVDLNGDGLVDITAYYIGSSTIRKTYLNTGSGWADTASYYLPQVIANDSQVTLGAEFADLNGDGLADLIWYREVGSGLERGIALNTGTGWVQTSESFAAFASPAPLSRDNEATSGAAIIDLNADGIPDIAMRRDFGDGNTGESTHYGNLRAWHPVVDAPHRVPFNLLQTGIARLGVDFVDLNADGAVDLVWKRNHTGGVPDFSGAVVNRSTAKADRLVTVTNGLGIRAQVSYKPLTDSTVYTKGTGATFPKMDVVSPMMVVAGVKHDDGTVTGGVANTYDVDYSYRALRVDADRGSLGFERMDVLDTRTGIVVQSTFSQTYPFTGMVVQTTTKSGSVSLSSTTVIPDEKTSAGGKVHFVLARDTVVTTRDLNGALLNTAHTYVPSVSTDVDAYGNITKLVVDSGDGFVKTTESTYDNDDAAWILGRLRTSKVSSAATNRPTLVRRSAFTYGSTTGLLATEVVEPDDALLRLTTAYAYDRFGNKTSAALSGPAVTTRETSTTYTTNGRFPATSTNALGHVETYTYDTGLGVLTSLVGPNKLETSWMYDGFGRKTGETRADGTSTETRRKWVGTSSLVPAGAKYQVETESTGTAPVMSFHDVLGRQIHSLSLNGAGEIVHQATAYDAMGRAYAISNPYRNDGQVVYWTQTSAYDLLNRPLTVRTPDDTVSVGYVETDFTYDGLTVEATDANGRVNRTVRNSQGWVVQSIRNASASSGALDRTEVTTEYDALGQPTKTTAAGVETVLTYDIRGRKTQMTDPSMGVWTYQYNAFGELTSQQDANGNSVSMVYDQLGRLIQRNEPEGQTTWTYDSSVRQSPPTGAPATWIGHLATVASPGGYVESHTYDNLGRPKSLTRTIAGTNYTVNQTYDAVGRPERTTYPTTFTTRNVYNQFGFLKEVRRADAGRDDLYWMADHYAADGRIDGEQFGNGLANDRLFSEATGRLQSASIDAGFVIAAPFRVQSLSYSYDKVGNVKTRSDSATGRSELFGYDGLDRLTSHAVVGGTTVNVDYNQKGNITYKSDVGSYLYAGRPYAVTTAGGATYTYDSNGNMKTGGGRTLNWTSFNQLLNVTKGSYSASFTFGAARERVTQTSQLGTTVYVGTLFERVTNGSLVENKHYIMAPTGRVAVRIQRSDASEETRYFHSDGLGSITAISDEAGRVVKRFAFDAWGKRMDAATNVPTTSASSGKFTRGFTDHEHLDDLGLVHMNGRVYDPVLGRFLSADPYVDDDGDSQSFNRYSYVSNNPLNATDPSGFFKLKDAVKIVAVVVAAYFTAGWAISAFGTTMTGTLATGYTVTAGSTFATLLPTAVGNGIIGGLAGGFASGFAGSLLNGGSIGDAFKSGVVGGIAGGVTGGLAGAIGDAFGHASGSFGNETGRAIAHGAVGGAVEEAQGGEFRHGFYTGFAGSAAGSLTMSGPLEGDGWEKVAQRTAVAAVAGGSASALGGGKFANGALTATFQHLFNAEGWGGLMGGMTGDEMRARVQAQQAPLPLAGDNLGAEIEMYANGWANDLSGPKGEFLYAITLAPAQGLTYVGGAGAAGQTGAWIWRGTGGIKQWLRVGGSYSKSMKSKIGLSVRWGSSPKHAHKIEWDWVRKINQWFRETKLPGNSWRTQDAGHLHIKK